MPPVVFDKMARKKIAGMVFGNDDNRAVSPVIGVILMVAITVILAAVIGTMVLGMTDSVGNNVQAGANVQYNSAENITVTFTSSQNAADGLSVNVNGNEVVPKNSDLKSVGDSVLIETDGDSPADGYNVTSASSYKVIVTAHSGETSTVVVDKTISA